MTIIPPQVYDKYLSEEDTNAKIDELFGKKFTITLDVTRSDRDHKVSLNVKDADGNEIPHSAFLDDGVPDPLYLTAYVTEVCGILLENGKKMRDKFSQVVSLAMMIAHADEIKAALKNEKENINED